MLDFVNPLALFALAAVAVPIIIHLINRRRFRRMDWAAMPFLQAVYEQNRRRILWEHLLLLALRCLLVALLALLFARPLRRSPLFGLDFLGQGRLRCVILLDTSPSMRRRTAAAGADAAELRERVHRQIGRLCTEFAEQPAPVSLELWTAHETEPFLRLPLDQPEALEQIQQALTALPDDDRPFRPLRALQSIAESLGETPGTDAACFVFSDYQHADWLGPQAAALDGQVRAALELLARHGRVVLVNSAPDPATVSNVGITELRAVEPVLFSGYRARFSARVHNWSEAAIEAATLRVTADEQDLPPIAVPTVPPGQSRQVSFTVLWQAAGDHTIELRLVGNDDMDFDNTLERVVDVTARLQVLLIATPLSTARGEAFYLARAIDPLGYDVRTEPPARLGALPLREFAAVWLVDPAALPPEGVRALDAYVREGGTVVLSLGPSANAAPYEPLWTIDNAPALEIGDAARTEAGAAWQLTDIAWQDELLRPFDKWKVLFQAPRFSGRRRLTAHPPAEVLARFSNPDRSPAVIRIPASRGRIIAIASSAESEWSDWPVSEVGRKSYVVFVNRLLELYSGADWDRRNYVAGAAVHIPVRLNEFNDTAQWLPPRSETEEPDEAVMLTAHFVEQTAQWVLTVPPAETAREGVYRLLRTRRDGTRRTTLYSFATPAAEGDPASVGEDMLTGLPENVRMQHVGESPGRDRSPARREYWRALAVAVLALLLLESFLAFRIGNPERRLLRRPERGSP